MMMFQQEMKSLDLGIAPDLIFAEDGFSPLSSVLEDDQQSLAAVPSPINTNQEELSLVDIDVKKDVFASDYAIVNKEVNFSDEWMDNSIDMKPFMEFDTIKEIPSPSSVVVPDNIKDTQQLIDEMEEFLSQQEISFGSPGANSSMIGSPEGANSAVMSSGAEESEDESMPLDAGSYAQSAFNSISAESAGIDAESADAEKLLDALIKGNISIEDNSNQVTNTIVPVKQEVQQNIITIDDSGYETTVTDQESLSQTWSGFSSIQQIVTEDGKNVMIIIAPPSPQSSNSAMQSYPSTDQMSSPGGASAQAADNESVCSFQVPSFETANASPMSSIASSSVWSPNPSTFELEDNSSDSDWNPYSPKSSSKTKKNVTNSNTTKRIIKEKKPYGINTSSKPPTKRKAHTIKDKKERKKMQNVQAARRYRDKKKAEQQTVEEEEQELLTKNKQLKDQLSDIENEVKTLKKLMTELGLVKLVQN